MRFREQLMLCCTGLLFTACMITLIRYGTYQVLIRQCGWDNAWTQMIFSDNPDLQRWTPPQKIQPDEVSVDWAAKYPFPPSRVISTKSETSFQQTSRHFHEQAEKFADWTNHRFISYQQFVEGAQFYQKFIGWNISLDGDIFSTTLLSDGHWVAFQRQADVSQPLAMTADFADFCKSHNIHFLVVLAPSKIAHSDIYAESLDASNANGDAFLHGLKERGIRYIDLRSLIEQSHADYHACFFKTDHHWRPETARLAAKDIEYVLNDDFGYDSDPALLDASNYDEVLYPARHLGGFGQRATLSRAIPDDISLFYPKFPTSFRMRIPSMQLDVEGDFSIFYDQKKLDISHGYYGTYVYSTYLYGERANISIHNLQKTDGQKLLLVRDSFSNAMAPFLALGMERLDTIDLRYFFGSLRSYIEQERPDTVVVCYTVSIFDWDHAYPRSVFDFQ